MNVLIALQAASHLSHVPLRIVVLQQNSVLGNVLIGFIHPAADTLEVVNITVEQLLNRVLGQILVFALQQRQCLERGSSRKRPASPAPALVTRLRDVALIVPTLICG